MHWQMVVPLSEVQLNDVNNDLEGRDDDLEIQVEDEITLLDSVFLRYDCLFVENPE